MPHNNYNEVFKPCDLELQKHVEHLTNDQKQTLELMHNAHGMFTNISTNNNTLSNQSHLINCLEEPVVKYLPQTHKIKNSLKRKLESKIEEKKVIPAVIDLTQQTDLEQIDLTQQNSDYTPPKKRKNIELKMLKQKVLVKDSKSIWEKIYKEPSTLFIQYLRCNQQDVSKEYVCEYNTKQVTATEQKLINLSNSIYKLKIQLKKNLHYVKNLLTTNRTTYENNRKMLLALGILPYNRQVISLPCMVLYVPHNDNLTHKDYSKMPIKVVTYTNYYRTSKHEILRVSDYRSKLYKFLSDLKTKIITIKERVLGSELDENVMISEEKVKFNKNCLYLFVPTIQTFHKEADLDKRNIRTNKIHVKFYSSKNFQSVELFSRPEVLQNYGVYKFCMEGSKNINEQFNNDKSINNYISYIPYQDDEFIALNTLDSAYNTISAILTFRCYSRIYATISNIRNNIQNKNNKSKELVKKSKNFEYID